MNKKRALANESFSEKLKLSDITPLSEFFERLMQNQLISYVYQMFIIVSLWQS